MLDKIRGDYRLLFGQQWPVWIGGFLIGVINVFLFLLYQPWTTLDGALNWGDWFLNNLGVISMEPLSPLLRSGSIINLGLLFGAMFSALLAGQFGIRLGPGRELLKGAVGGLLMGTGAVLVRGCNIGGFFNGISAFGLHGLTMGVGLAAGAFLGARYLVWEAEHASASTTHASASTTGVKASSSLLRNPVLHLYVGAALLVGLLAGAVLYLRSGYADRAAILLFGALLGVISQRSRICFVRAFREPFLSGESSHTRAMLLALVVSIVGFALVKYTIFEKVDEFVRPTFWLGSLTGGIIFGVGMVLAGGCGGGTIWRAGEGHIKLWVALAGYVLSASLVNTWLQTTGLIERLGEAVFLPDVVGGWGWSLLILFGILVLWYLVVRWNEVTHRLAALY